MNKHDFKKITHRARVFDAGYRAARGNYWPNWAWTLDLRDGEEFMAGYRFGGGSYAA